MTTDLQIKQQLLLIHLRVKILELKTGADGKVETARVNMGAPILEAAQIPVDTKELKEYKGCEIETIAGKVVKTPVVDETIVVEA